MQYVDKNIENCYQVSYLWEKNVQYFHSVELLANSIFRVTPYTASL